jgi:hypothetical protein
VAIGGFSQMFTRNVENQLDEMGKNLFVEPAFSPKIIRDHGAVDPRLLGDIPYADRII